MNRIDRLTAILVQLQSKRVVKAEEIADRFEISLRTVYRDIRALMEGGVPIGSEAGKGYFMVDGYNLPPVMFTQEEASSILLAGKLVERMTDHSVKKSFESALLKIKAILNDSEKDHLEHLHATIEVSRNPRESVGDFPNRFLTDIQQAAVQKHIIEIEYCASYTDEHTRRTLEPIGLLYYGSAWHLIAWCHLRNDYRDFRADRIKSLVKTGNEFVNRNLISLQEYLKTMMQANREVEEASVIVDKEAAKYIKEQRYMHGFVSEEDLGDKVRMTFLTSYRRPLAKWLLTLGRKVSVESPEKLKETIVELVEELAVYYNSSVESS